jgi:long-chain acyl-CoA synthetase
VGRLLPDVEAKIADDGEILVRSPRSMKGYSGTTEAMPAHDGFLATGDLGEISADGWVRLLGRKREILNAPDGTNVSAARIERLLGSLPWVQQCVAIGDQLPFIAALVVMKDGPTSSHPDGYLAETEHPEIYARAASDIESVNSDLERVEKIRAFALFSRPIDGALYHYTRTGKTVVRRGAINAEYTHRIQQLYARPTRVVVAR